MIKNYFKGATAFAIGLLFKNVGTLKVIGAGVFSIISLLSKEFLK